MTCETLDAVVDEIRAIAARSGYDVERLVVFGSHAHGEASQDSDVDVVIVSEDFEDVDFYARTEEFYWHWDADLPNPDFVPLTPTEFDARAGDPDDIVHEAVETGVEYAISTPDEIERATK